MADFKRYSDRVDMRVGQADGLSDENIKKWQRIYSYYYDGVNDCQNDYWDIYHRLIFAAELQNETKPPLSGLLGTQFRIINLMEMYYLIGFEDAAENRIYEAIRWLD